MKKLKLVGTILSMTMLLGLSQAASAHDNSCTAEIVDAKAAINLNADKFLSKNYLKDIAGLIGKLDAADGKLDQGKADDARQKVSDALNKLDQMLYAPKPKIEFAAWSAISLAITGNPAGVPPVDGVLSCIDAIYK